jgi:hypothetical protein
MKYLSAFLIIMVLIMSPSCKWLREKGLIGKKKKDLAEMIARQDSLRVADSIRKAQERLLALEQARLDSISRAEQERLEMEMKNRYNIIVGCFITPEYARGYASEFTSRGYPASILKLEGTDFEMVSAESHQSLRKAIERLRQFQDTVAFDAWLYIYK